MSIELENGLVTMLASIGKARPILPQPPTFPAIRYQRTHTRRTSAVDGRNAGVTEAGVQIDCIATSYSDAKLLADSVRTKLHGYMGEWGTLTAHFVELQTENDFYEQDGDRVTHWVSQRYQIYTNMD